MLKLILKCERKAILKYLIIMNINYKYQINIVDIRYLLHLTKYVLLFSVCDKVLSCAIVCIQARVGCRH